MDIKILNKEEFESYLPAFNTLFESAFNKSIHSDFFSWRYLQNPHDDLLVAVAIENNELVANYSASPVKLIWNDTIYNTALSMTTMTHPNYQGRGLFPILANTLYDEMKKREYIGIWGFPNNNSHGSFIKKLSWTNVYEIPNFSLSLQNEKIKELNSDYKIINDDNFSIISEYRKNNRSKIEVFKDQDYYQWRYKKHPYNDYQGFVLTKNHEVIGYVIIKVFNHAIDILEFECKEQKAVNDLINYLVNYCIKFKLEAINSWVNLFDELHLTLERRGFVNNSPLTYFGYKEFSDPVLSNDYKNWRIQMGDSDVY